MPAAIAVGGLVRARTSAPSIDDRAGDATVEANDRRGELGAPGAHQAADAEHLAACEREVDVVCCLAVVRPDTVE